MCQTTAYIIEGEKETLVLQDVVSVRPEDGTLRITNLFGEEKTVSGRIKQIDMLAHKIIIAG
jgi:predicted RNA-binding protein